MNVRKHGISTSSFPISQHCKITALMEPKGQKKNTTTIRFKDIFGRKGLLISKTYHDITLSIHVPTHHPYCICSRKSDFASFYEMPHGICQLSQRLWRPWQSSRCLSVMEDEDLSPSCWWASGRPLKSLHCQVVAEWSGECWGRERHRAPLVQESRSRPARQPKAVHI